VLVSCTSQDTPLPPSPTIEPGSPTSVPPTAVSNTPAPSVPPETDTRPPPSPDVTTFPNPEDYTWQSVPPASLRPVDLQADGSGRLFVVEKIGHIHVIEDGQLIDSPFLNIEDRVNDSSNEMGLLGLAFHPNYAQNGYFYVNYTGSGGDTFISRFQVTDNNPYLADPASEVNLLRLNQPFPNHNGGGLDFGPDGYLYAGLGDGGAAGRSVRQRTETRHPPRQNPASGCGFCRAICHPCR
jgi:glucose/arabinose dehydrogenase